MTGERRRCGSVGGALFGERRARRLAAHSARHRRGRGSGRAAGVRGVTSRSPGSDGVLAASCVAKLAAVCVRHYLRVHHGGARFCRLRTRHRPPRAAIHGEQQQEGAKQAAEAQLRLLQAQIEAHFLLNTLANVRSLVKRDTTRATEMLDHLSDYLHVALSRMRQTHSTLAREAQLSESFLSIMQLRMAERLKFSFDIPADLGAVTFPADGTANPG